MEPRCFEVNSMKRLQNKLPKFFSVYFLKVHVINEIIAFERHFNESVGPKLLEILTRLI